MKAEPAEIPVRAVGVLDAARMFGLSKTTLRRAIRDGRLRSYRVGRRVLLKPSDIELWIENENETARAGAHHGSETTAISRKAS